MCVCVRDCVRVSVCVSVCVCVGGGGGGAKQFTPCLISLIRQMTFLWYLNRSHHCISSDRRLRES